MSLTYCLYDNILLLKLYGDLLGLKDERAFYLLSERHIRMQRNHCIIDTSSLGHVNSKGLSIFVRIFTLMEQQQLRMVLIAPPAQLQRLLKVTKLDKVFTIVRTRSEALRLVVHAHPELVEECATF
ncbi:STAS domain-containing protein [Algivirga pacifica]|uniref:STAS domain-containing protein n=1 Tax=Algivirga pacifica TaxID=1162670 RepID=UPI0031E4EF25